LTAVVVGAGGFVGYRYWAAKKAAKADAATTTDTTNPAFDNSNPDPSAVLGAVSPTNSYGIADTSNSAAPSTDTYGFHGTTNDQWSQYAATQLAQTDRWDYGQVVEALGLYLTNKPTSAAQQSIVTSAVAVAGYPPVGQHVFVNAPVPTVSTPTPATPKPVTPSLGTPAVHPAKVYGTSVRITWSKVSGAKSYEASSTSQSASKHTTDETTVFSSLKPNTHYTFHVRAIDSNGHAGPWGSLTVTTSKK
jgi:hypothetical protein